MPLIWARILSEMASPAASSAARLMRSPDDSFSMLLLIVSCVPSSWRCALNASILVLMRSDIPSSLMVDPGHPDQVARSPDRGPQQESKNPASLAEPLTPHTPCAEGSHHHSRRHRLPT